MEENIQKTEEETITLKKDTLWKGATFVFAVLFVVSLFTGGFGLGGNNGNSGTTGAAIAPPTVDNPEPSAVKVSVDDDAVLGKEDAPVTIIEFSDYQCPFCGRHFTQTYPQLKKDYVDTGKIKIVFRDFPLNSIHPQAQKAAEAAECAGEQGKYWEMHDKLFENQGALDVASLKSYAQTLGLNTADFNSCLDSGKMASEVAKDLSDGQSYGVQGTPAFFVEGKLISGAQPYSVFQQELNVALA
jgi:protein-disulfide isomerase